MSGAAPVSAYFSVRDHPDEIPAAPRGVGLQGRRVVQPSPPLLSEGVWPHVYWAVRVSHIASSFPRMCMMERPWPAEASVTPLLGELDELLVGYVYLPCTCPW
jgi:hypothetical protein